MICDIRDMLKIATGHEEDAGLVNICCDYFCSITLFNLIVISVYITICFINLFCVTDLQQEEEDTLGQFDTCSRSRRHRTSS